MIECCNPLLYSVSILSVLLPCHLCPTLRTIPLITRLPSYMGYFVAALRTDTLSFWTGSQGAAAPTFSNAAARWRSCSVSSWHNLSPVMVKLSYDRDPLTKAMKNGSFPNDTLKTPTKSSANRLVRPSSSPYYLLKPQTGI